MRTVNYKCDCCSEPIEGSVWMLYGAEVDDTESVVDGSLFQQFDDIHLCDKCYEDIDSVVMAAISNIRTKSTKQTVDDVPDKKKRGPEKGKPKRKIDDGKILALRNAGWSVEKIADEMRIGTSTVWMHLKNMRGEE